MRGFSSESAPIPRVRAVREAVSLVVRPIVHVDREFYLFALTFLLFELRYDDLANERSVDVFVLAENLHDAEQRNVSTLEHFGNHTLQFGSIDEVRIDGLAAI